MTLLEDIAIPTNIWINIIASVKQVSIPLISYCFNKALVSKMSLLNFQHWLLSILILETDLASQATTPHVNEGENNTSIKLRFIGPLEWRSGLRGHYRPEFDPSLFRSPAATGRAQRRRDVLVPLLCQHDAFFCII